MEQYKQVFTKKRIKDTFFFKIVTRTEYMNVDEFKENNEDSYNGWFKAAEKRYLNDSDLTINDAYLTKACYMPELSQILGICVGRLDINDGNVERTITPIFNKSEKEILEVFFAYLDELHKTINEPLLFGYHISTYDIPFIIKRALKYELKIPVILKNSLLAKPWEGIIIDGGLLWKFTSNVDYTHFNEVCRFLNLKYKNLPIPLDEISEHCNSLNESERNKWLEFELKNKINLNFQYYLKLRNM